MQVGQSMGTDGRVTMPTHVLLVRDGHRCGWLVLLRDIGDVKHPSAVSIDGKASIGDVSAMSFRAILLVLNFLKIVKNTLRPKDSLTVSS